MVQLQQVVACMCVAMHVWIATFKLHDIHLKLDVWRTAETWPYACHI